MIKLVHSKKIVYIFLSMSIAALFFVFVNVMSKRGIILLGDNNITLLKENKYLLNPFLWIDNDFGYQFYLFTINYPVQIIFKALSFFFDINFISNFYHYGSILIFLLGITYLIKNIGYAFSKIEYVPLLLFSVSNPLISSLILTQTDLIYSLAFVSFFVGHIFYCRKRKSVETNDIIIFSFLILFINTYIFNTILLFFTLFIYFILFQFKFLVLSYKKLLLAGSMAFLLNFYWVAVALNNYISGVSSQSSIGYSVQGAIKLVENQSSSLFSYFSPYILLPQYVADEKNIYHFFSNPFFIFSLIFLTSLIFYINFYSIIKKRKSNLIFHLLALFVIFYCFSLGTKEPFSEIFLLCWKKIPFFNFFRSVYKFQLVNFFVILILLCFAIIKTRKKILVRTAFFVIIFSLVTYYFSDPFYTRLTKHYQIPGYYNQIENELKNKKLLNTYKIFPDKYFTKLFLYTPYEWNSNNFDSQNILPIFTKQNTAYVAYVKNESVSENISRELCMKEFMSNRNINTVTRTLGILNSKHLIMQNDIRFKDSSCFDPIEEYQKKSIGKLDIYDIGNDNFLPHFYTPKDNIISQRTIEELPRILSQEDYNIRSAIFFENQNTGKERLLSEIQNSKLQFPNKSQIQNSEIQKETLPILEFKKINPTKYRVVVHQASGVFPLVFSESYHDGWRLYFSGKNTNEIPISKSQYPNKSQIQNPEIINKYKILDGNEEDPRVAKGDGASQASILDSYKILDGNEEDQATKTELVDFIKNGWITTLGDQKEKTIEHMKWDNMEQKLDYKEKYNIDFISKNFQGTIQNDNLPNGSFYETWMASKLGDNGSGLLRYARNDKIVQLPEENHLMANGYANSWAIDTDSICGTSTSTSSALRAPSPYKGEGDKVCIKNADGSYDFEMVVEFWPQRLFYIGLAISGTTLLICLGYLAYNWRRSKKNKISLAEKGNSDTISL